MEKIDMKALETEYKHLFETYEGEAEGYYTKGEVLRGIEVDNGWNRHVKRLLKDLEWCRTNNTYIDNPNYDKDLPTVPGNTPCIKNPNNGGNNVIKIFQIKEKFGDATVYVTVDNPRAQGCVDRAVNRFEVMCSVTCMNCGQLSENLVRTKGWVTYICGSCASKGE